jgi:hypothetical protein
MVWWDKYQVKAPNMRPKDEHGPQFPEDKHGPGYNNEVANDWRRGANEDATTRPGYVPGGGRAKRER